MTTVFANGVFDSLHAGHVRLLDWARNHGDRLIVAINSDASTRRLKGEDRPINSQDDRRLVLLALRSVDAVIIFDEDTPELLIENIVPQVLVKGPAERSRYIPGAAFVVANGGRVLVPDWPIDHSTSGIIERIRGQC